MALFGPFNVTAGNLARTLMAVWSAATAECGLRRDCLQSSCRLGNGASLAFASGPCMAEAGYSSFSSASRLVVAQSGMAYAAILFVQKQASGYTSVRVDVQERDKITSHSNGGVPACQKRTHSPCLLTDALDTLMCIRRYPISNRW